MADGSVTIKVDMDGSGAQAGVSKLKSLFGSLESTGQKQALYSSLYQEPI